MTKKLTLSVEKKTIEQAKAYAEKEGRSLSSLVEQYLRSLVSREIQTSTTEKGAIKIGSKVEALWGSVKAPDGVREDEEIDYKALLSDAITEKYLR